MTDSIDSYLFIALIFVLAGFVKGVIGLGLPTVAIALLSLMMPPAQAAAVLVVPSLITNIWQMWVGPHLLALVRRLWTMMLGICVGTWLGAGTLPTDASGHATTALGVVLLIYAVLGFTGIPLRIPAHLERMLSPLCGVATGVVTAATGVLVIPAAPYLQSIGLDRHQLVQAFGLSFTVSTAALGAALAAGGVYTGSLGGVSVAALAPAILGMVAGQWLRGRVSAIIFRRCLFGGLVVLGIHLALRGLL